MSVRIVRLGTARSPGEGLRIGTVRRPPRGVPKQEFSRRGFYDVWLPILSPSGDLVDAARSARDEAAWRRFVRGYRAEMNRADASRTLPWCRGEPASRPRRPMWDRSCGLAPGGPFQLTNGKTLGYRDYTASPAHRFYQMWQQLDCNVDHATADRPSGCDVQLFAWVAVTVGQGSDGRPPAPNFSTRYAPDATTTGEGSEALGFYNVQRGDVPYFKGLADQFAMSDNYHQAVNGGTGVNHIVLGHGDLLWYSDGAGHPRVPPHGVTVAAGTRTRAPHCEPGHYYLLNNYNPGYFGDGTRVPLIVVSPYTKPGHVSHDYTDHVSILKFIERNWRLAPLTRRSRDNLPNPVPAASNSYVPANTPAIGDLFDLCDFPG